jgi:hypothetical protein
MDHRTDQTDDEQILTYTVSDEALEGASERGAGLTVPTIPPWGC